MKEVQAFLTHAGALIALACAAGCAQVPAKPAAETAAMQRSSATTSIVDYVSKADVGQSSSVAPADGQQAVTVRVISAYAAASGRTCRQYVVTEAGGKSRPHLACSGDQGWVEVRPLIVGEGTGREPRSP